MFLNLYMVVECTESEGPGKRFAIWVQGCLKKCKNCCNQKLQKIEKNHIVEVSSIIELISKSVKNNSIEGITLLGGEPLLQSKGLSEIAKWCKNNSLSVMLFTGYDYNQINDNNFEGANELLKNTDILVDGEYIDDLYDETRSWIGSKNQNIYYLTNFYKKGIEYLNNDQKIEIRITENNLKINGWPFM